MTAIEDLLKVYLKTHPYKKGKGKIPSKKDITAKIKYVTH